MVPVLYALAAIVAAALGAALVAVAVALLAVLTGLAFVVAAAVTTAGTAVLAVVLVSRAWLSALSDDETGHLGVAPPEELPPGRDPGYRSYYFGPAWLDYARAAISGAGTAREMTVGRDAHGPPSVLTRLLVMWRLPDDLEFGTGTLGKIVSTGALLGGLIGLVGGGLVAAVFVLSTTLTFAVLLGAVVLGMITLCGILRGIELGLLRLRGITVECPSCHHRIGVPVYECPTCQEAHRRLVPGTLGVVARTCRCGTSLPTLIVRGRSGLRARCSHDGCGGVLPLGGLTVPTRHIPVVAGPAAGKTVHTMAAVDDLCRNSAGFGFADAHTRDLYEEVGPRLRDIAATPATLPTAPLRAATFFLGTDEQRRLVYLYDVAGERYRSDGRMGELRFLGTTAGVLLIVDPLALGPIRARMESGDAGLPAHSDEDPGAVAGRFTAGLRERGAETRGGRIAVPLAVVVTKCDLFTEDAPVRHPHDPPDATPDARSDAVQEWLDTEAGEGGLVRQLAADYADIRFFAVSAIAGSDAHDRPGEPISWLLSCTGGPR